MTGIIFPDRQKFFSFAQDRKRLETKNIGWDQRFPVCVGNQLIVSYNITGKLFVSRFANFEGILGFSVLSIILADLLGNRCSFQRVHKVMVCNLRLVDFDPFLFLESLPVSGNYRLVCCRSDLSYEMQCCQLSRIIRETPDFGLYLPVFRLESDISRIIGKVAISCRLDFPTINFQIFCVVWATATWNVSP